VKIIVIVHVLVVVITNAYVLQVNNIILTQKNVNKNVIVHVPNV